MELEAADLWTSPIFSSGGGDFDGTSVSVFIF
jgi:hypothetical protein